MNKEQIIAALIPVYNAAYDEYFRLTELSIQLLHEDEDRAYRVIARKAMDGIKSAAEVLGITEAEFLSAAADQNGKEDAKC